MDSEQLERLADAVATRLAGRFPQQPTEGRWLTSAEAARYLGASVEAIRDLAAARKIAFSQTCAGAPMYFDPADLDAYRRQHRREAVN